MCIKDPRPTATPVMVLPGACAIDCQDGRRHWREWTRTRQGLLVECGRRVAIVLFQGRRSNRFYLVRVPKHRVQPTV